MDVRANQRMRCRLPDNESASLGVANQKSLELMLRGCLVQ